MAKYFRIREWMTTDELAHALDDALGTNDFENIRLALIERQQNGTGLPFTRMGDGVVMYNGPEVMRFFQDPNSDNLID